MESSTEAKMAMSANSLAKITPLTIVVAPDSFKGSLTAIRAAEAMRQGIQRAHADLDVRCFPMADGGEGMIDSLISCGGMRRLTSARDARGVEREVATGLLPDGTIAIEAAQIVGIMDAANTSIAVTHRTTLGVGDAIRRAMDAGSKHIVVGLGGSCTNDGGAGLLVALGARLLDDRGTELPPVPEALQKVARIDLTCLDRRLAFLDLQVLSDVDNPLTGVEGATAVFGPQKGVEAGQISLLDSGLVRFAGCLEHALGKSACDLPGSGAAGGLGFALRMLGATLRPGAEVIADVIGLDAALREATIVVTGEGASDTQTLHGKAPFVVCRRARRFGKPTILLSGCIDPLSVAELNKHFLCCLPCVPGPVELATAMKNAASYIATTAEQITHLFYGF